MSFNWDMVEAAARESGRAVRIGVSKDFTRRQKSLMSQEAHKRNLNIIRGNSERNDTEKDGDLYVIAKL